MTIAILADPLDNQHAGVHVYTRELVHALVPHSSDHEFILIRQKRDPKLPFRQIIVPTIKLPIGFSSIRLFLMIPVILRFLKVDAVFEPAHFGPFNLPRRIKRITMIHDLTPIILPHYHRWHSQVLQNVFLKHILKKADLVLSNSHNTSRDLSVHYPFTKNKTNTIHLGKEEMYQPTDERDHLDKLDIYQPYFLSVGTIEPRKNLILLLDAYEQFRTTASQHILLVIAGGKGWKSEAFFEKLAQHPFRKDILMTGFVPKEALPQLYSHSLALIYPSEYEGFGFPILEAMTCGALVICSNNSSLPEVGGDAAFYFETSNVLELVAQMKTVAGLDAAKRANRREESLAQSEKFDWNKYAVEFVESLKTLVNQTA